MKLPIYMDYQSTTMTDPRVLAAMIPYFTEKFGNPSSRTHKFGWEAEDGVEEAREQVAKLIGANSKEIVFTSGATESNNLAIKGVGNFYKDKKNNTQYFHFDLYKKNNIPIWQLEEIGFHELFENIHNKCFIEWPENLSFSLGGVEIIFTYNEEDRIVNIKTKGNIHAHKRRCCCD
jgi:hypothetical protein